MIQQKQQFSAKRHTNLQMLWPSKRTMRSAVCASLFTGKERDAESGNDYFGKRYYASSMGRWLSPGK
jgi:RHS repeat-associated protein